ncbi:thyrotropin-releasing hormone receptor-like [Paramacrobiotus metropolitanus]|uniref:thyrotropin-releasing hormone receptor-like n=1 Tax=Paramacrobiotus metropolitanus TaxID=2943436 RepID=UPI0024464C31|nr:thyrotropin-releasing hormone receptor-like [Paramacrobiotus metropolitanus]
MYANCSDGDVACQAGHMDQLTRLFNLYNQLASVEPNLTFDSLLDKASHLLQERIEDVEAAGGTNASLRHAVTAEAVPTDLGYKVTVTISHLGIFLLGCVGNVAVIGAAFRSKFLRTPTYSYLVSLAIADLLVLCTAIPQDILNSFGQRWMLGYGGCAVVVFLNFFGINVGSMSILAFTAERYVAICQPLYAYRFCTVARTRNIIRLIWMLVLLYSGGWLLSTNLLSVLSTTGTDRSTQACNLVMPAGAYTTFFAVDLLLFYAFPLFVCVLAYTKIFIAVKNTSFQPYCSIRVQFGSMSPSVESNDAISRELNNSASVRVVLPQIRITRLQPRRKMTRTSTLRLLVIVVVFFAGAWLPFRLIPVYKSYYRTGTSADDWYLFCAHTLVYLNCASNPILYNVMSPRFRAALRQCGFRCIFRRWKQSSSHGY